MAASKRRLAFAIVVTSVPGLHAVVAVQRPDVSAYVLTYTPAGVRKPGWHELKVRLAHDRANIVARPGYFANTNP